MITSGQRLARVQLAGHHAIDALAAPLAAEAEAIVRAHAPLTEGLLLLLRNALHVLLLGAEPRLTSVTVAAARQAQRVADPFGPPDEAALAAVATTTAASLATYRPRLVEQALRLVQRGLAMGATVIQTAQTVRQYVYRRDPATGLIQSWPGQANMAMQHARGLMLSESTAGHFRGMLGLAVREDGLLWYRVSQQHAQTDVCDQHARADMGFGPGLYLPGAAPALPTHFRCRCCYASAPRRTPDR